MQVTNGGLPRPRQGTVGHALSPLDNSPPLGGSIDGRLRGTIQSAPTPPQQRTQHSQIAIQFVKDFYLTLASQGESVWPYYHENDSVLSRPEESHASNDNSNVTGQLHIYRTLASLGLRSSRYKINTVDSQPSVDGGVHLLVTGLVQGTSSRTETPRTFAQSFHLARTKDGASYYIRNDILRIVGAVPATKTAAQPAVPQQPQQSQPQPSQPAQGASTQAVVRPRAIPSTNQINQLSVSLTNTSPTNPSIPAKIKSKDFSYEGKDAYDPIVISSSTTHSISHTLNNATAIPDKIITHTPQVNVSTAVTIPPVNAAPSAVSKPKWGDREQKDEEDDEDEEGEDYEDKKYEYEQGEKWRKKPQSQPSSQPTQSSQTQPAVTRSTQPAQTQAAQTQPQQQQTKTAQPTKPTAQHTPTLPSRQVPAKPVQSQPSQQSTQETQTQAAQTPAQQPQAQQAQVQVQQEKAQATPQVQAEKKQTQTETQAPQTQAPAKQQTQQTQQPQRDQKHSQQPTRTQQPPRETKTYAGRIGIGGTRGYYRQPAPPKPVTTTDEKGARKDGGGRGQGGRGGRGGRGGKGRGGGRGQGTREFRPIAKEPTPSLYVSNLPEGADVQTVTEKFKAFGAVRDVDFPSDKNFCFVHFETQDGVDKAMATEEEFVWDGYSVWYEPKRLPAPRGGVSGATGGGGGGGGSASRNGPVNTGAGKGGGNNGKATEAKHETSGKGSEQPQKQKQQSQASNQESGDQEGAWKKVEHRSTARRKQAAEKKNENNKKQDKRQTKHS